MKNIRRLAAAIAIITILVLASVTASAAVSFADTSGAEEHVTAVLDTTEAYQQLNNYRRAYNLTTDKSHKLRMLKRDSKLEKIAMIRAMEIAETGAFSHTRPNGQSGLSLVRGRRAKGENLGMGQQSCGEVSAAWYASPGHRKNMLRRNFKKVGIAEYTLDGVTYWAEVFSS